MLVRVVGVDLAAEPDRTAVAVLRWGDGKAVVQDLRVGADDEALLAALADADKAGIDAPFGWPDAFIAFLAAHQAGDVVVPGDLTGQQWRRQLAWRRTDEAVRAKTRLIPLSVAADRIGHAAMRCAGLLAKLGNAGRPVARDGSGTVTEVYPAASLKQWGLPHRGYKQPHNLDALPDLVTALQAAAPVARPRLARPPLPHLARCARRRHRCAYRPRGSFGPDSPPRFRTAAPGQPRRLDRAAHRAAQQAHVNSASGARSRAPAAFYCACAAGRILLSGARSVVC